MYSIKFKADFEILKEFIEDISDEKIQNYKDNYSEIVLTYNTDNNRNLFSTLQADSDDGQILLRALNKDTNEWEIVAYWLIDEEIENDEEIIEEFKNKYEINE